MKRVSHQVEQQVQGPAERLWQLIRTGEKVDQWLPQVIKACRVEGTKRYCSTEDATFEEDILLSDDEHRIFRYSIPQQPLLPVEDIIGQMEVTATGKEQSVVRWSWEFDVDPQNEEMVKDQMSMLGQMGIAGLQELAAKQISV